jgi:hypothetical protein
MNIWKITDKFGNDTFVRCPGKSGAKVFASRLGAKGPLKAEVIAEEFVEGEIFVASFPAATVEEILSSRV